MLLLAQMDSPELSQQVFTGFTWLKLMQSAAALVVGYALMQVIERGSDKLVEIVPKRLRLLVRQAVPIFEALIIIMLLSYILNLFVQFSASNILALTGTLAVALGFAFKDYVSSIIAGIVALFEAPYRMGDRVQIGGHFGEVIRYGIRAIKLRTLEDDIVTIPHNLIWNEPIANANNGALEAQVNVDFFVSHHADLERVKRILYYAAYSSRFTQLRLPIAVVISSQPWGMQCRLKCYPLDAQYQSAYTSDLNERVKAAFRSEGVEPPDAHQVLAQP